MSGRPVIVLCLLIGLKTRSYSQALPADIFSMPLGYHDESTYAPHPNTLYGIQNPGLNGMGSCFGIDFGQLYHAGVDLYKLDGTSAADSEATAVANGIVIFAQDVNYPGSVVVIKHDDPFDDPNNPKPIYSVYAHLNNVYVSTEQAIMRGDSVGTIRKNLDPGFDDSHLHFEIRYFEDGGNLYTNYPNCNGTTGKAGKGYTYPEHPDNFPAPEWGYTDPLAFIHNRSPVYLPIIHQAPSPTPTLTPTITPTPTKTATSTPTATPTPIPCVAGVDLVQNGDFTDPARHDLWVSNQPDTALIYPYVTTPEPNYGLLMGYENSVDQTIYQTITVPPAVKSADIQFWLYVRTQEILPIAFDYLYVDLIGDAGAVMGASLLHEPFAPFTNRTPQGEWRQQILHVDDIELINMPIRLHFHATTNWALATAFYVDNVQLITRCQ